MIWVDRIAQELKGTKQHIDDMFTPSGYAHVGSLRGPVLHDLVYKVLKEQKSKVIFTYVFNDFDPIDGLPADLVKSFAPYLGYPLRLAPSPDGKARSFADYFAADFKKALDKLGVEAHYLSSWDMYHEGRFNQVIAQALNNAEKIQEIYQKVAGSAKKRINWYPFQVVCPQCHKLGTTKVTGWDGQKVAFSCEKNLVTWATGCGYQGEISPFDGNGKLPWKVDWPAHWKVLGVTFEGAGKDHTSRGGSYDIAFALCQEVFHYPKPYYFPYEHFLLGGKKMSSSKGIGLKARDLVEILPAELARFLLIRLPPNRALEFKTEFPVISALFDEFDRCAQAYWQDKNSDLGRIFALSQVNNWYEEKIYLPRFTSLIAYVHLSWEQALFKLEKTLGRPTTKNEQLVFKQRMSCYQLWQQKREKKPVLTSAQKNYLTKLASLIEKDQEAAVIQQKIITLAKQEKLPLKQAFGAIYLCLIGQPFGPKAGELILAFNRKELIEKLTKL